jgi:hypothetical protein
MGIWRNPSWFVNGLALKNGAQWSAAENQMPCRRRGSGRKGDTSMLTVLCPDCRGAKSYFGVACSPGKCRTGMMTCGFCEGTGHVSPEANARWQKGRALRDARVKAGLTQREQAYVLGINWIDLNDVEHGRRAMEDVPRVHYARE